MADKRKIDAMNERYGVLPDKRCEDCDNLLKADYHGRQTYMPGLVRGIIRPHLTELDDNTLAVMIEDCGFQRRMKLYGDERIDLPGWLTWEQELLAEKERRDLK